MISQPDRTEVLVVLVRPTQARNVGSAMRAAANFGAGAVCVVNSSAWDDEQLRLVRVASAGSWDKVGGIRFCRTIAEAAAGCSTIVGTSARIRRGVEPVTAEKFFNDTTASRVAVVFGPESQGLSAQELAQCHSLIRIPTSETFPSMNLSHAVALVCYEATRVRSGRQPAPEPGASLQSQERVTDELISSIVVAEDLQVREAARLSGQLRRLLHRANPTEKELGLLNRLAKALRKSDK